VTRSIVPGRCAPERRRANANKKPAVIIDGGCFWARN
jgi:hypothetical protein